MSQATTSPNDRAAQRDVFLQASGYGPNELTMLRADASTRSYGRLAGGAKRALLMDALPAVEGAACPPEADEAERGRLGYNAMARLAGPRLDAFTALSRFLQGCGLRAPTVMAEDRAQGFAIIEDFGDRHLADAVAEDPRTEEELYRRALAALAPLRRLAPPSQIEDWPLQTYDALALRTEAALLPEWYMPFRGVALSDKAQAAWDDVWQQLLAKLSAPQTLVLRDYHAQNLLVPDDGPIGVIDFQDALIGHAAYDVASLLEDARRDVDKGVAARLLEEEVAASPDPDAFRRDYAILALQRNAKILGIFARLTVRDNKPHYATLLPRVEALFARDLARDDVAEILPWFEQYLPSLLPEKDAAQ